MKNSAMGSMETWSQEDVENYLFGKGINRTDIKSVNTGSLAGRIHSAGHLFADVSFHTFSSADLGMIVYFDELPDRGIKKSLNLIGVNLANLFENESELIKQAGMPRIQYLRIITGNNLSNLHRLKGFEIKDNDLVRVTDETYYDLVQTSYDDWKDGVNLPHPNEFTEETIKLFGYIWAGGRQYKTSDLYFVGTENRRDLLLGTVKPSAEKVFNVPFSAIPVESCTREFGDTVAYLRGVAFSRGSRAISTFLKHYHGLSKHGLTTEIPKLKWDEDSISSFLGAYFHLASGLDQITTDSKEGVRCTVPNPRLAEKLSALLTIGDYGHSVPRQKYANSVASSIYLHKEASLRLKGHFLNP
ncbi:hypothetical protein BVX95_01410 [archaeon D22]|nr:hypothetical protein BVX95_01410 [archaeon D22]